MISSSASTDPTIKRVRLNAGQKAPFPGQLLSDAAAAKLITDAKAKVDKLQLRIKYLEKRQKELVNSERAVCGAKLETAAQKLKLTEDTCKMKENILHGAVDRTAKSCARKWYESPILGFALGAGVAGGLCTGVAIGTK